MFRKFCDVCGKEIVKGEDYMEVVKRGDAIEHYHSSCWQQLNEEKIKGTCYVR